ncbi:tRNA-i(6)A37 thiotransferase enzyme MiaB [Anaerobacterium chartisolvens]|uniref:tRNA-2-methylthio-N(6)-dimethylallyladenosine synthase n=1 Tax=Anaerobacterium chartisolvens TaxID=1297424 RepID=A0A369AQ45_9FIRM|nr:tRNA (N6-isopentenyl adenosine(37)-C2)-methylthiotransferase MiaB [Anaerobacterium chartisolvens]RCX10356.1 tRNA-i(6)A37 thiotransferase enzyme MiaB [Anaerobacterium chartisolvens]
MSERQTVCVPQEEILKQKEFINSIKELNLGRLKKYSVTTFGCQMNENDSERLAGMLSDMGYTETESQKDSDVIIYNTCCVRENAELKVYGHLGALKRLKEERPEITIAVCGCMMQQKEVVEHIKRKYRHVDIIFGTHNLYKFPELLYGSLNSHDRIIDIWETTGAVAEGMPIQRKQGVKAFVTVMYGCNNYCSYCIVPYVRGRERSRSISDIVNEVSMLGQHGCKEVTLLGQNVNSFGKDAGQHLSFAKLLSEVNGVPGIERIRFMTSHPKDLTDELIYAIRDCDKVCPHLHLPVQSGSTRILNEMNRKYSKEHYLGLVEKVRSAIPEIAFTTDIIVGFPGETEEDFNETLDILERVRFDSAYTFLYSKRTGTPAAKNAVQIPEEVKKLRFERLVEVQNRISREINLSYMGTETEVLVEGLSKSSDAAFTGRTGTNKVVNFKGSSEMEGSVVTVKIEEVHTWSLEGKVIR